MIRYVSVTNENELTGILALQQQNLARNLTPDQINTQGFVTVEHSLELLKKMHAIEPSIIAKDEDQVMGYCLAMTQDLSDAVPVLIPMFESINSLTYQGKNLNACKYMVVGQVCVAQPYRGKGVLRGMYQAYKQHFDTGYEFAVTEIASRNTRSLQAHRRIGFDTLHTYNAPDGESWQIVIWNWH